MSKLRRRLTAAGYRSATAAVLYAAAEILPFVAGGLALATLALPGGIWRCSRQPSATWPQGSGWPARRLSRQKKIRNGLPDALDLMIVCIEAGSGIDQSIVKTSDELDIWPIRRSRRNYGWSPPKSERASRVLKHSFPRARRSTR